MPDALPPYQEEIVSVEIDPALKEAYQNLEQDTDEAPREHRGTSRRSVRETPESRAGSQRRAGRGGGEAGVR
jgi:hypothetical protein